MDKLSAIFFTGNFILGGYYMSQHFFQPFVFLFQPHQIGMTWQYTIEWHQSRDASDIASDIVKSSDTTKSNRKNIVTVTSKPRSQMESSLITVTTWTSNSIVNTTRLESINNATLPDGDLEQPLSVFAQVLRGGSPILGARVMLTVEIELGNGSVVLLSPVQLSDDGFGGKLIPS